MGNEIRTEGRKLNLNEATCGVQVRCLVNTSLDGGLKL